jgi:hypothetical protein
MWLTGDVPVDILVNSTKFARRQIYRELVPEFGKVVREGAPITVCAVIFVSNRIVVVVFKII